MSWRDAQSRLPQRTDGVRSVATIHFEGRSAPSRGPVEKPTERFSLGGRLDGRGHRSEAAGPAKERTMSSRILPATLRRLARQPLFTGLAIFTLALALGANGAIFSVVDAVLIQPLPYPESERLVGVWNSAPGLELDAFEQSEATYLLFRDANRSFESIGLYEVMGITLTGEGEPLRLDASQATASTFDVLGVPPALGRSFLDEEESPGAEPVVMLSHALWHRHFGADPGVLDRQLTIDGISRRVVGVMGEDFRFPTKTTQLWIPFPLDPAEPGITNFSYFSIARLRPDITPDVAARDLESLLPRLAVLYPEELDLETIEGIGLGAVIRPLRDEVVGEIDRTLWILFAGVGFILLIACANIANLFLVRAEGRRQELAVRSALGASRGRVASAFLGESLALGVAGAVLGLGLSHLALRAVVRFGPQDLPRIEEIGLDGRTVLFTLGATLLACLAFGLLPMLRRLPQPALALRDGGRSVAGGRGHRRARGALVVAQVALAVVLLVGSGLMLRSFAALRSVDPGFRTEGALTLRIALPDSDYPTPEHRARFFDRALESVATLPGIETVAGIDHLPLDVGNSASSYTFEDFPIEGNAIPPILSTRRVSPRYFEAMGIPLIRGRDFLADDHRIPRRVAVISAPLAERLWPGQDPTGKRLLRGSWEEGKAWTTIVGVVGGIRHGRLEDELEEMIYFPLLEPSPIVDDESGSSPRRLSLVVRSSLAPSALVGPVRQAIWDLDANLPIAAVRPIESLVGAARAETAFTMVLLSLAAGVALLLGAVGLYGVISTLVSQRTQEIGVRMALGATRVGIGGLVLRQGLGLAAIGVAVGVLGAIASGDLLRSILFGVAPGDLLTYTVVIVVLLTVATLASLLPARRAASVDPLRALEYE